MTNQTQIIGFTGGMGAGKSSLISVFAANNIPVLDTDKLVAEIYGDEMFCLDLNDEWPLVPGMDVKKQMSDMIAQHPSRLKRLEEIIGPWLDNNIQDWIKKQTAPLVAIDAPMLFEAGWDKHCDFIIGLSCRRDIREERVMMRPGMTQQKMNVLMANQLTDDDRDSRCGFKVSTECEVETSRNNLQNIIDLLTREQS